MPASTTYGSNTVVTLEDNTGSLAKSGYGFTGWNTAADGSGTNCRGTNYPASNATLYAQWSGAPDTSDGGVVSADTSGGGGAVSLTWFGLLMLSLGARRARSVINETH